MNRVLLVSAASFAALVATPAAAEHWSDRGFPAAASVNVHRGGGAFIDQRFRHHDRDRHDRHDRDGRRDRRDFDRDDVFGPWDFAYDFDGNRSFDPDKLERLVARTAVPGLSALGPAQPRLRPRPDVAGRRSVALQLVSRRAIS